VCRLPRGRRRWLRTWGLGVEAARARYEEALADALTGEACRVDGPSVQALLDLYRAIAAQGRRERAP